MVKGRKNEQSHIDELSRDEVAIKCGQFKPINFPVGPSSRTVSVAVREGGDSLTHRTLMSCDTSQPVCSACNSRAITSGQRSAGNHLSV